MDLIIIEKSLKNYLLELNYWKNFDLETCPELWGFSENDIKEIDIIVKEEIDYIFEKAYNQQDTEEDTIFNNVY